MGYILEQEIGAGAFGKVWRALDTDTGQAVAVKVVNKIPGEAKKPGIDREHYIPLLLQTGGCHKNISCLLDFQDTDKSYMFVTEYITGGQLAHKNYPPDNLGKLDLAYQLADGLDYMHQRGIAHRDIKPANIVLRGGTHIPVYIDFGLACIDLPMSAKAPKGCAEIYNKYRCGTPRAGSPNYMSPEMTIGNAQDPLRSDIYSLGVLFYNLFNDARFPYKQKLTPIKGVPFWQIFEIMNKNAQIKKDPKPSKSGISNIDQLIDRMLATDPAARPSAADARGELAKMIKS